MSITPGGQYTDEELLQLVRSENGARAIDLLFRRHAHKVLGLCISYLKNQEDGEDAAMEIFENLNANLASYEIQKFEPWLFFVTRNHCLKILRRKLKQRQEDLTEINPDIFVESGENEDHYLNTQIEHLSDAIDQLREEQRTCIVLFFLEQRSYKEIADLTSFPVNQVKSYIQNGKRNLKNALINAT